MPELKNHLFPLKKGKKEILKFVTVTVDNGFLK